VDINNLQCTRDVKSCKVKLHREITVVKEGKTLLNKKKYIKEIKYRVDVAAQARASSHLEFELPDSEDPAITNQALQIDPKIWH
jgi:hypothetical protein